MKIYILTEGGKGIGFGHITRCLSIYQAFEERGFYPEFIINGDSSVLKILEGNRFKILNWLDYNIEEIIKDAEIVIIDSYLANVEIYEKISLLVKTPVYLDDTIRIDYPKGIVINGSLFSEELPYPKKDNITYLLGSKFIPLRKEFWECEEKVLNNDVKNIFITFGGNGFSNINNELIKYLDKKYPNIHKNLIIGNTFEEISNIQKTNNLSLFVNLSAKEIKNIMLSSDIAISSAGQTLYELAKMSLPTVAVAIVDNQLNNIKGWEKTGFIEYAGFFNNNNILENIDYCIMKLLSVSYRKNKIEIAKKFINGSGSLEIVDYLIGVI